MLPGFWLTIKIKKLVGIFDDEHANTEKRETYHERIKVTHGYAFLIR